MLVTLGICFKQHFDTRYFAFCNFSPPRMFLLLDLLSENRIQHGTIGPIYITSSYSTRIFYRGVSGFVTDCPCGVLCRRLTPCLLHVCPLFGNRLLNNSWAVDIMDCNLQCKSSHFCILIHAIVYVLHHMIFQLYIYILNSFVFFIKYSCTNIFHRRSLYTFYYIRFLFVGR